MLVEREKPLNELMESAQRAQSGRGRVVAVTGEAGIGKTSLLDEFRVLAGDEFTVCWGACDALVTPRPFGPLHDMADSFNPAIGDALAGSESAGDVFANVVKDLNSRAGPSIIIIEDIHWADQATLDFIKYLGRRIAILPAILVISLREGDIENAGALDKVFGDIPQGSMHRVALRPLSLKGVKTLCGNDRLDGETIHRLTAGNPFFVTEVIASGGVSLERIPPSVKDAVAARIARLGDEERGFLETISVIPGPVGPDLVEALFGPRGDTFIMACIGRNLLMQTANGVLRFRHELARLATLSRMSVTRQKAAHRRILCAYDSLRAAPPIDQLVHHASGALDGPRVLTLAPEAAQKAAALGSHREAAAHLHTALEYVDQAEPETAARLYQDWAYEAGLADRIDNDVLEARRHALTLWRALARPDQLGENLRWLSRLHWYRGESAKAQSYADEAVRVLEAAAPSAERAMAYSFRSQIHMLNDEMNEAVEWGERALHLAHRFGNTEAKVHALNNIGTARIFRGKTEGVKQMKESLALALDNNLHEHAARVYTNLSEYAVEFRDFALAEETLSEGIVFDTHNDLISWTHYLVGRQAQLRLEQGRLQDAETIARGVLDLPQLTLLMRLPAFIVLARARLRMGGDDAEYLLNEAMHDAEATNELQYMVPLRLARVEHYWLTDNNDRAKSNAEKLASLGADSMHNWNAGELAIWARRLGMDIPASFQDAAPAPHQLELAGENERAAQAWRKIGAPFSAGVALIARPSQISAEALFEAIKIFQGIYAAAGENKARAIAESRGFASAMPNLRRGPYKASRKHPLGLTEREQEILKLICKGQNNVEIAKSLSRSKKTIEHHASSIFKKMNVSNRMDALLRVQGEPWLSSGE